jgi:hypothetical protein
MSAISDHDLEARRVPWPVMASSLWLRAGVVAAGAVALGIAMLVDGSASSATAVALVIGGAAATYGSIRRSWQLLRNVEARETAPSGVPAPHPGLRRTVRA